MIYTCNLFLKGFEENIWYKIMFHHEDGENRALLKIKSTTNCSLVKVNFQLFYDDGDDDGASVEHEPLYT